MLPVRLELHDEPLIPGQRVGVLAGCDLCDSSCAMSPPGKSRRSPLGCRGTLRCGVALAARCTGSRGSRWSRRMPAVGGREWRCRGALRGVAPDRLERCSPWWRRAGGQVSRIEGDWREQRAGSAGRRELEAWDLGARVFEGALGVRGSPTGWRQTAWAGPRVVVVVGAWAGGSSTRCLAEEIAPGSVISETKTITRGSF
jgi:hypothetical protein